MEVLGKIKVLGNTQNVTSAFTKRELVVATEEQFPQFISINFVQDKCDLLNIYKVGDNVKVSINLRGREWINPQGETKYFNDIQGWRVEKLESVAEQQREYNIQNPTTEPASLSVGVEDDNLPF